VTTEDPVSCDPLDLDAIEARMAAYQHILDTARYDEDLMGDLAADVFPLVAEVRRLREAVEDVLYLADSVEKTGDAIRPHEIRDAVAPR
jgi:hypothetical protein